MIACVVDTVAPIIFPEWDECSGAPPSPLSMHDNAETR